MRNGCGERGEYGDAVMLSLPPPKRGRFALRIDETAHALRDRRRIQTNASAAAPRNAPNRTGEGSIEHPHELLFVGFAGGSSGSSPHAPVEPPSPPAPPVPGDPDEDAPLPPEVLDDDELPLPPQIIEHSDVQKLHTQSTYAL